MTRDDSSTFGRRDGMDKKWRNGMFLALLSALLILMLRIGGLGPPMLFADEYFYAASAFHLFHPAYVPFFPVQPNNYLYSLISSIAFLGQGDLVVKARMLNVLFALFALPPLAFVTRGWLQEKWQVLLVVAATGLGFSGYLSYFMPETLYFTVFCYLAAAIQLYFLRPSLVHILLAAVAHGALISVKPHGLFLFPAAFIAILLFCPQDGHLGLGRSSAVRAFVYCAVAYATFAVLSSIIAAHLMINPFEGGYSEHLSKIVSGSGSSFRDLLNLSLRIAVSDSGAVLLIAGPSIVVFVVSTLQWLTGKPESTEAGYDASFHAHGTFLLLSLLMLFAVTVIFSASVASGGVYEGAERVHGRYLEAALIMLLVVGACRASIVFGRLSLSARGAALSVALLVSVVGFSLLSHGTWQYSNDFSVGYSVSNFPLIRLCAIYVAIGIVLVGLFRPAWISRCMVTGLVAYLVVNSCLVDRERIAYGSSIVDRFGEIAMTKTSGNAPTAVLFKSYDAEAFRAAFYMIGKGSMLQMQPSSGPSCAELSTYDTVITLQGIGASCGYPVIDKENSTVVLDAPATVGANP
jgi:hypothetical protein